MKRKLLTLSLSLCVLTSICVPGTLATKAAVQSTLVCEKAEHTHTDACYTVSDVPTCGLEAGEGAHTHDDSCYEEQTVLTCTMTEDETHTHGDECYTAERILVCGREETAGHTHDTDCYDKELSCTMEEHIHDENCYEAAGSDKTEQPESSEPVCNCGSENDTHAEDCPLYTAPVLPEPPAHIDGCSDDCTAEGCTCPCHTKNPETPAEPETPAHIEGCSDECTAEDCTCPCHEKKPVHIEGCSDECDGVDCECECHKQNEIENPEQELSLLERLLACETMDELFAVMDEATDEEWDALTQEDFDKINDRIAELMPTYIPEPLDPAEVEDEMIPPAVNFTNVAPFGDPVIG